jgi:hypothetical protein
MPGGRQENWFFNAIDEKTVVVNRGRERCSWGGPLKCEADFGLITLHHPSLLRAAATGANNIGSSVWRSPPKHMSELLELLLWSGVSPLWENRAGQVSRF